MKRFHEEISIMIGRAKSWMNYNKDRAIGYFRNKHPLDCGHPKCHTCHSNKFPKREETRQELKSKLKLKEKEE